MFSRPSRHRPHPRTIQPEIRRLERHLHKRIGAHPMVHNEVLPISLELQRLTVVLANQVAQPRLCKPDSDSQGRRKLPLELLRCRVNGLVRVLVAIGRGALRGRFGWFV